MAYEGDELFADVPETLFDQAGPCPACAGTGIDNAGDVCGVCGGSGQRPWGDW